MTTTTLEAVRDRARVREGNMRLDIVSTHSLRMDPANPGRVTIKRGGGQEVSLPYDDYALTQLAAVSYGMPSAVIKKLIEDEKFAEPSLAADMFNHFIERGAMKAAVMMLENRNGEDHIVGVKSDSWNLIPYSQSVETLMRKFGPGHPCDVTAFGPKLAIDILLRELPYKFNRSIHDIGQRDDPWKWGLRFSDSDVGLGDAMIHPFTQRVICLNGATTMRKGIVYRMSHSDKSTRESVEAQSLIRQGLEMVDSYSTKVADQITASQGVLLALDQETNLPLAALDRIKKNYPFDRLSARCVNDAWEVEGKTITEPTAYRLHNAFSRAGTHAEDLDETQKMNLQAVGGAVLECSMDEKFIWN